MKYIRELDGLRGLLAVWVLVVHVLELGPWPQLAPHLRANVAVDIFIILSGFVIFHLLSRGENYRSFIVRRFFRLFPVFIVCFGLALAVFMFLGLEDEAAFAITPAQPTGWHVASHLAMLHGAIPNQILPESARAILPPAWSISVEWQFYLVAPLLFALFARPNARLALFAVLLLLVRILCEVGRYRVGLYGPESGITFDMQAFLPLKLEYFAIGAGTFGIWQLLGNRTLKRPIPPLVYALALPVLLLMARKNIAIALWLAGMGLLFMNQLGVGYAVGRGLCSAMLQPTLQWLGKLSYCIYLLHVPVLVITRESIRWAAPSISAGAMATVLPALGIAATIFGAWLLHRLVEQPAIALGKRVSQAWGRESPVTSLPSAVIT